MHIDVDLTAEENSLDQVLARQDMEPDEDIVSEWLPIKNLLEQLEDMIEKSDMELDA